MARSVLSALVLLATAQAQGPAERIQRDTNRFPSGIWEDLSSTPQRKGMSIPQQRQVLGSSLWDHWPSPRYGHSMSLWKDQKKFLMFGGLGFDSHINQYGFYVDALSDLWEYDIENSLWTPQTFAPVDTDGDGVPESTSPPGRSHHVSFHMDHKMFVYGGVTVTTVGSFISSQTVLNDFWVYDPTVGFNGGWADLSASAAPPFARHSHSVCSFREHVYVFGGANISSELDQLLHFSTDTLVWSEVLPSGVRPPARFGHSAVMLMDEAMYVFGGQNLAGDIMGDLWKFSIRANAWKQIIKLTHPAHINARTLWPPARTGHAASGTLGVGMSDWGSNRGKLRGLVVYGGWAGNDTYLNDVWEFKPGADLWVNPVCTALQTHTCGTATGLGARWRSGTAAYHNLTVDNAHRGTSLFVFGGSTCQIGAGSGEQDLHRYYV